MTKLNVLQSFTQIHLHKVEYYDTRNISYKKGKFLHDAILPGTETMTAYTILTLKTKRIRIT